MNKTLKVLRDYNIRFRTEDAGEGVFLVIQQELPRSIEKKLLDAARTEFRDVQWCPDPESHGDDAVAVLNLFYPREAEKKGGGVVKAIFACPRGLYRDGKCEVRMEIQSLLFDKSKWGEQEAVQWAKEHGFRAEEVESSKSGRYWRIRQEDPSSFDPQSFRIKIIAGEEDVHEGKKQEEKKEVKKVSKRKEFLKKLEEVYWEDYHRAREVLDENRKAREAFAKWVADYVKDELSMGIRDYIDGRGRIVIGHADELIRKWLRWERRRK